MKLTETPRQYLTVKEVAALINIAEKTLRKYIWQKKIPYSKINGHVRFDRERLELWLSQRAVPTLDEIQLGTNHKTSSRSRREYKC